MHITTEMKVAVVCLSVALIVSHVSAQTRRNVLLIYGDDAGFQMGAYNNTACKTPNFDKLAARSVVFKHGYTSVSSCSPSRSVLLTGLPQHQNGMYGLHHDPHHFNSMDTVRALPTILGNAGIRTGIIGKKHVGPDDVYKFDYEQTEENNDLNQVGRNITYMKKYVREFLNAEDTRPFLLYLAYHDPHRCGQDPNLGQFCERFGDGQEGHGVIPDWNPVTYRPEDVEVPYYLPDTPATRQDLANMYKTYSRMDQGLGIFLKELEDAGFIDNTLILYSSDNGIPFPGAKTNLYDPGMGEPMMVSSPLHKEHWGKVTEAMGSTMDFVPTILEWFNLTYPKYAIDGKKDVTLTGKSLLPVAANPATSQPEYSFIYSSHDMHEVTMFYPMRVLRTHQYKLIHNLNSHAPYPLATDIYQSPTFLDLLNRTHNNVETHWFKPLNTYYYRDQWELYDHQADPMELRNLANVTEYQSVLESMKKQLFEWQTVTSDPWRCYPAGVLEGARCEPLYNGESPPV
ncbi:N-sulphoglucosamine sulphohydrolase-like [Haliotis asinina]|uniref:N-sulphoglucosamine sulphohydrolase-like n=1 Tax=Haliotis asinina TaxID=109174 RepID=UPI0035320F0F